MKQSINEARRMQQLAGIIKENYDDDSSGYSYEYKEGPGASPQEISAAIKHYQEDKFTWKKVVKNDYIAMANGESADIKSEYYPEWKKEDFQTVIDAIESSSINENQESEVMSQLKSQMGNLVKSIDTTLQDKTDSQNEGLLTTASIAIALPAIIGLVAKFGKSASGVINKIMGKKPTEQEQQNNWFAKLGKIADDLHHLYMSPLEKVVSKFVKDPAKAKKVAHHLFHIIVAIMLIASGATAIKALQSKEISLATLETALSAVKSGEIESYISKLLA